MIRRSRFAAALPALTLGAALLASAPARADEIHNPTAIFAGLDKITGRIIAFDVAMDETVQFGTLQITPRVCLTRPQTEAPLTEGFVEVDEIESAKQAKRVFSGWMFAASPGLHGVEHPVYDVWLKDCKGGKEVVASPVNAGPDAGKAPPPNAGPAPAAETPPRATRRTITPQNPVEPRVDVAPEEPPPADQPAAAPEQVHPEQAAPEPVHPPEQVAPASPAPDRQPAAQDPAAQDPAAQDNGLGAPVEVGPPPGAPKPQKHRRRRRQPAPAADAPQDFPQDAPQEAPQDAPRGDRPQRERLEPMTPNDLPGDTLDR